MSKLLLSLLLSTFLLTYASLHASPANQQDQQEMQSLKMEKAKLHAKERLLRLKQALSLRDNQINAWKAYQSHVLSNSGNRMRMIFELKQKHSISGKPPTSLELAKANIKRLQHNLATAKTQLAIFSDLYQVLDQQQRAIVDKLALQKVKKQARKARGMKHKDQH